MYYDTGLCAVMEHRAFTYITFSPVAIRVECRTLCKFGIPSSLGKWVKRILHRLATFQRSSRH